MVNGAAPRLKQVPFYSAAAAPSSSQYILPSHIHMLFLQACFKDVSKVKLQNASISKLHSVALISKNVSRMSWEPYRKHLEQLCVKSPFVT